MKHELLIVCSTLCFSTEILAQTNCNSPTAVTICPSVYLSNQTNAGMVDDGPSSCNITGEDLVYEVSVPFTTKKLFASIVNASAPFNLSLVTGSCQTGGCNTLQVPAGDTDIVFKVSKATTYYLWVDAANTITYDISLGADTDSVYVSVPNTMGNLQFDSSKCDTPVFLGSKPFFQVNFNGVDKTNPLTMTPLNDTGLMCITTYFKNTTGDEGINEFNFTFPPAGFSMVNTQVSTPGFYNAGSWIASHSGAVWTFTFNDSAGLGRGDFTGTPNTCLRYQFCFEVIPISNDPNLTQVNIVAYSDSFGAGHAGYVRSGCCPKPYKNCLGGGGGGSGGGRRAFAFGFNDPGGPLPVNLIDLRLHASNNKVLVTWTTSTEVNNDYFEVERSTNARNWIALSRIDAYGNSSRAITYQSTDDAPLKGISYYRLRQIDFDGRQSVSETKSVFIGDDNGITVFPNPTKNDLTIISNIEAHRSIALFNAQGQKLRLPAMIYSDHTILSTSQLQAGIYFLVVEGEDSILHKEKIMVER